MPRKNALAVVKANEFTRAAYLRAKVLDTLSTNCHEQFLLFDSLGHEEMATAFSEASSGLHVEARKLFPLYPHEDFIAGREWAQANGFDV